MGNYNFGYPHRGWNPKSVGRLKKGASVANFEATYLQRFSCCDHGRHKILYFQLRMQKEHLNSIFSKLTYVSRTINRSGNVWKPSETTKEPTVCRHDSSNEIARISSGGSSQENILTPPYKCSSYRALRKTLSPPLNVTSRKKTNSLLCMIDPESQHLHAV